jgi:hypothetical protein
VLAAAAAQFSAKVHEGAKHRLDKSQYLIMEILESLMIRAINSASCEPAGQNILCFIKLQYAGSLLLELLYMLKAVCIDKVAKIVHYPKMHNCDFE